MYVSLAPGMTPLPVRTGRPSRVTAGCMSCCSSPFFMGRSSVSLEGSGFSPPRLPYSSAQPPLSAMNRIRVFSNCPSSFRRVNDLRPIALVHVVDHCRIHFHPPLRCHGLEVCRSSSRRVWTFLSRGRSGGQLVLDDDSHLDHASRCRPARSSSQPFRVAAFVFLDVFARKACIGQCGAGEGRR